MHNYYIYMITDWKGGPLYTGVTNDLERRVFEHKQGTAEGFSKKYYLTKLVYMEHCNDIKAAIAREKQIKGWTRAKKDVLVNSINPDWKDLSTEE